MSLVLVRGTIPKNIEVKTSPILPGVRLGEYELSVEDFLCAAHYVLTNTDLEPNDPRLQFIECVKSMKIVGGWGTGRQRLDTTVEPVLDQTLSG